MTKNAKKDEKLDVSKMRITSKYGERLYLNTEERKRFKEAAEDSMRKREITTFALILFYTGARISEALNIEYRHIDMSNKCISINTLKKRKKEDNRQIPIPDYFCTMLDLVHEVSRHKKPSEKVWKFARNTAFLHIKKIFKEANIDGPKACPKGLRHSFGVHAVLSKVQLNMLQKWMGHSHISTTSIYANAQGKEAREIAKRMW